MKEWILLVIVLLWAWGKLPRHHIETSYSDDTIVVCAHNSAAVLFTNSMAIVADEFIPFGQLGIAQGILITYRISLQAINNSSEYMNVLNRCVPVIICHRYSIRSCRWWCTW